MMHGCSIECIRSCHHSSLRHSVPRRLQPSLSAMQGSSCTGRGARKGRPYVFQATLLKFTQCFCKLFRQGFHQLGLCLRSSRHLMGTIEDLQVLFC